MWPPVPAFFPREGKEPAGGGTSLAFLKKSFFWRFKCGMIGQMTNQGGVHMLKLILGRAGSGKTTVVLRRICRPGQEKRQILMVPEQQSHEAERAGTGCPCMPRCSPSAAWQTGSSLRRAAWGSRSWTPGGGCC